MGVADGRGDGVVVGMDVAVGGGDGVNVGGGVGVEVALGGSVCTGSGVQAVNASRAQRLTPEHPFSHDLVRRRAT
jgi:hypothetical protein